MHITIQPCKVLSDQKPIFLDRIMALIIMIDDDNHRLPLKECVKVKQGSIMIKNVHARLNNDKIFTFNLIYI